MRAKADVCRWTRTFTDAGDPVRRIGCKPVRRFSGVDKEIVWSADRATYRFCPYCGRRLSHTTKWAGAA